MTSILLKGLFVGLGLSLLIGPVFFALIHTSIKRGFTTGLAFACGIFLSDVACILLANLGLSHIAAEAKYRLGIGVTGGIIMILFGIYECFHEDKIRVDMGVENLPTQKTIYLLKAFVLNIINPFVMLFWIAVSTIVHTEYDSYADISLFFLAILLTAMAMDTMKVFIANKIKVLLTGELLASAHKVSGTLLMIFGITMICRVILKMA